MKNKRLSEKSLYLLVGGLAITTAAQIVSHFFRLADIVTGYCMGVGIGLLLLALTKMKRGY